MLFLLIASAFAQSVSDTTNGFAPIYAECIALPCDTMCQTTSLYSAQSLLTQLGITQYPGGVDETMAPMWAAIAYITSTTITLNAGDMLMEINPKFNNILECEARNAGLVWADYSTSFGTIATCLADIECATAFSLIVTKSATAPPEPFDNSPADWTTEHTLLAHLGIPIPDPTNTEDALCGVLFTALEVENIKAINFIALFATELLPLLTDPLLGGPGVITGDEVLVNCNNKVDEHIDDITQKVFVAILGTAFGSFFGGVIIASLACCCYNRRSK